jgi:hypothetical protein
MAQPRFEVIDDEIETAAVQEPDSLKLDTVLAGLRALPQKAANAIHSCFVLLTVATVFWLTMMVIGSPSTLQLTGLAGYAMFILVINWIVKRR